MTALEGTVSDGSCKNDDGLVGVVRTSRASLRSLTKQLLMTECVENPSPVNGGGDNGDMVGCTEDTDSVRNNVSSCPWHQ